MSHEDLDRVPRDELSLLLTPSPRYRSLSSLSPIDELPDELGNIFKEKFGYDGDYVLESAMSVRNVFSKNVKNVALIRRVLDQYPDENWLGDLIMNHVHVTDDKITLRYVKALMKLRYSLPPVFRQRAIAKLSVRIMSLSNAFVTEQIGQHRAQQTLSIPVPVLSREEMEHVTKCSLHFFGVVKRMHYDIPEDAPIAVVDDLAHKIFLALGRNWPVSSEESRRATAAVNDFFGSEHKFSRYRTILGKLRVIENHSRALQYDNYASREKIENLRQELEEHQEVLPKLSLK